MNRIDIKSELRELHPSVFIYQFAIQHTVNIPSYNHKIDFKSEHTA